MVSDVFAGHLFNFLHFLFFPFAATVFRMISEIKGLTGLLFELVKKSCEAWKPVRINKL